MSYKIVVSKAGKAAMARMDDCLIAISLTHPRQQGARLSAIIEWASQRFERVEIDIGGTLSRHNMSGRRDEARTAAFEEEGRWIAENEAYLGGRCILRWSERLAHPDFRDAFRDNFRRYQRDGSFRQAIDNDIGRLTAKHPEVPFHRSRFYLLEEFTADALHAVRPTAFLYPGAVPGCYAFLPNACWMEYACRRRKSSREPSRPATADSA